MKQIVVLTIKEACDILEKHGMKISEIHLRAGIACGAYPFGVAVQMEKQNVYEIFKPLLMQWIEERSMDVD